MAPSTARSASRLWGGIRAVRRSLSVATPELGRVCAYRALFARDRYLELGGHFRMQPDRHAELSQGLDRLLEPDAPALDLEPVLAEELRHVGASHRSEQARLVGSLAALGKVQRLDGLGLRLRVGFELAGPTFLPRLDALEVLHIPRGGVQGELLRQEVIAGVSVGHITNVSTPTERADIVEQDDLHREAPFILSRTSGQAARPCGHAGRRG